jgi:hypothetical protein
MVNSWAGEVRNVSVIRRRTRVVGAFPDGHSTLMLVAARLWHIAATKWGERRYLGMEALLNPGKREAAAWGSDEATAKKGRKTRRTTESSCRISLHRQNVYWETINLIIKIRT